ncbi:MAG: hypothetical protein H7647_07660 [Candidatus Heimdallarchaeota archaeon]|nr:hypothetical protein [Candidatus Heimdallarchaeota archaeon]MCK4254301.1 hypothetical protein [Candidatus Heimdallarchaeota archaeon]
MTKGQEIAKIGFSESATTYSHLHYQLMPEMSSFQPKQEVS